MSPEQVVQNQLDAYNAKDINALLDTYAVDAEHFSIHGASIAKGHDQMRVRFLNRFKEPDLHAKLLSRVVMGNFVVDTELITRNFDAGIGTVEMLCIYEVVNDLIVRASFALGDERVF
jgi:hypothetical protein